MHSATPQRTAHRSARKTTMDIPHGMNKKKLDHTSADLRGPSPLACNTHTSADLLGPSPLAWGLAFWAAGILYCFSAWHIHAASPMIGLGLMGMSPPVTMYCFFNGLSRLKRAWLHGRTLRTAARLQLAPSWGSGLAGFFLVDEQRGICVANGKSLEFSQVTELECRSTHMAHRLFLRGGTASCRTPLEIGFGSQQALHVAALRLQTTISTRNPGSPIDITHTQP